MKKPNYGSLVAHTILFLGTVWWTLGFGNLAYLGYKYVKSPEKVVRDEDAQ